MAALVFAAASALLVAFQLGLALGAPWGRYAMGGRYPEQFPPALRVAAIVQAAIVAWLALVLLSDAGLLPPGLAGGAPWLVWVAAAFSAVAVVLNAITRSAPERRLWLPVAIVMLASSVVIALT